MFGKKQEAPAAEPRRPLDAVRADAETGLTEEQVRIRNEAGWVAGAARPAGLTEKEILLRRTFTFFNLIFVVLALLLLIGGSSILNMGFLLVAAINTAIGIIQEIRAKRSVDKLSLLSMRPVRVIRGGRKVEIRPEYLVRDDIAEFHPGDQIPADGILRSGEMQVDESLLTGESDAVTKKAGNALLSGSFVLTGHGRVQLTAVGADAYAAKIAAAARTNPKAGKSEMMRSLDKLIKVIGIALIPVGIALLCQELFFLKLSLRETVEGTVAALVGMIPEGLYLLTSIAMAASAIKLGRENVLVQDMNCMESLARVDVLCVDKTGTVTEPKMEVHDLIPLSDTPHEELEEILAALYSGFEPDNDTGRAMAELYGRESVWKCSRRIPFSPKYKWSGGEFAGHGAYLAGAPEFILGERIGEIQNSVDLWTGEGCRVLLVAAYGGPLSPDGLDAKKVTPLALVLLHAPLRPDARETFEYFRKQGVTVKVISGDNARTASKVAQRAEIPGAEHYIDAISLLTEEDYAEAAEKYTVFGRVTPEQKQKLIAALQKAGHTVAMTGDGVNDLLAMKQADCSVAMASGAQAASQVASLVLLNSDFGGMPRIVGEGRRVINNIQRAAALFLVKNIFSALLALISLITAWPYPLIPVHLTLVASLTIGIPSFFLAMEPNYERVSGRFLTNVFRRALPGGLTNVFLVTVAQVFRQVLELSSEQTATVCAAILGAVGLLVLLQVCQPFDKFRKIVWIGCAVCLVGAFFLLSSILGFETGTLQSDLVLGVMLVMTPTVFFAIQYVFDRADMLLKKRK